MNAIARDDADVGLSAAIRKRSNRWHFLCGDKGRVYFSKVYRDIASSCSTPDDMQKRIQGFVEHVKGNHENEYCTRFYKKCKRVPEYEPTFTATREDERAVLMKWADKYGSIEVCRKYHKAVETNVHMPAHFLSMSEGGTSRRESWRWQDSRPRRGLIGWWTNRRKTFVMLTCASKLQRL
jgi:hypothetical protein